MMRSKIARRAQRGSVVGLSVEQLEVRQLLTAVVVDRILDSEFQGAVTLRDAIMIANGSSTPTTITFDPTAFATAETIALSGEQLELTNTAAPTTITAPALGVTVSGNGASRVLYVDPGVTVDMTGVTITDGVTSAAHGGAGLYSEGTVTMTDCFVSTNTSTTGNGGVGNGGTMTLTNVTIANNTATGGTDAGGVGNEAGATLTINRSSILTNTAAGNGGGISNAGGTVNVTDSTLRGNSAATAGSSRGGGIYSAGTLAITGSTLNGNGTPFYGGAVDSESGTLTMINDTVTISSEGSGAIFVGSGTADLESLTVSGNTSLGVVDTLGGAVVSGSVAGAVVTIGNSIIAGNTNVASAGPDVLGTFASRGNNLIGATDQSSGWMAADLTGTAAAPLAADLAAPADNGGPTLTMLPTATSPAIGSGSVALIPAGVTTDQRGDPRTIAGGVDIGAVEVGGTATPTPTPTSTLSLTIARNSVPTTVIAGAKLTGSIWVAVNNAGATTTLSRYTVGLYAAAADGTATSVGSFSAKGAGKLTLKSGKSATLAVRPTSAGLSPGAYTIVAKLSDATGSTFATVSGPALTVEPATIDLSAQVGSATLTTVKGGKLLSFALTVSNAGNTNSTGPATIAVYLSTDGTALTTPITPTITRTLTVRAASGKMPLVRLKVAIKVPATVDGTGMFPVVVFTQAGHTIQAAGGMVLTVRV